ncbi:fungal specific transcription factor domain-containing protein [Rhodotorula paludigena]|uniref:fungal specific transcription factor domain-containing protein n=1 Tax=Rhodotorula paludigena TaxID=86838 RepID=UPI00316CCF28
MSDGTGSLASESVEPTKKRPRISQRAPQAVVVVRGEVQGGRPGDPPPITVAELLAENAELRRQLELVQSPAREVKGESPAPAFYKAPADLDTPLDLENARTDLSTVGLLVERDPDPRSPVENGYLFPSAPRAAVKAPEPEHLYTTVPPDLVPLIPSPELSTFLIRRALYLVGWMHVAVHKPTFTKKHEAWQAERAAGDQTSVFLGLDWLALYFAFLALGAFFVEDDDLAAVQAGLPLDDLPQLPRLYFNAALSTLDASDYLRTHGGRAIQAIHVLLFSLMTHEWLSPSAQQPGTLIMLYRHIGSPAHCEDEDIYEGATLVSRPPSTLTTMSFHVLMHEFAQVCRVFNERYCAAPEDARAAVVQATDHALADLFKRFPHFEHDEPYPDRLDAQTTDIRQLVPWMRYSAGVTLAHRRIVLYRLLLRGSQPEAVSRHARKVCLEAARKILAERRRPKPALYDRSWRIGLETATAGFTIASAYRLALSPPPDSPAAAPTPPDDRRSQLSHELREVISFLTRDSAHNAVAKRAADLLSRQLEPSPAASDVSATASAAAAAAAVADGAAAPALAQHPYYLLRRALGEVDEQYAAQGGAVLLEGETSAAASAPGSVSGSAQDGPLSQQQQSQQVAPGPFVGEWWFAQGEPGSVLPWEVAGQDPWGFASWGGGGLL